MVSKREERKEGGGRGKSSSRLHRTQNVHSIGFCFAGIFLLRWPGWYFLQMHLWECVRVGVAGFLVWQTVIVGALMVGSAVVWVMADGSKEKEKKAVRGSEEDWYYLSSRGGGDGAEKGVRFDDGDEMTPTSSSASFRFNKGDMPRKHPSSVGMGRFLKDMNLEGFNDTFIAREREGNREMTVVYHSICSREQHWESSFEELRLQDYKKMGRFVAFAPPLPPPPATNTTNTTISPQQQPRRSAFDGGGGGGERGRWAGVKQALPSWLSSRTFRESAFDCSVSSYGSDDELSSIGRIDASLLAAGLASSPVPFHTQPEDMGTESGVVRRRFT